MENTINQDTVNTIKAICYNAFSTQGYSFLEIINSTASSIIALANIVLLIYIFRRNNKKEEENNEKKRKLELLKILVLDYNMKYLYAFFEEIIETTTALSTRSLTIEEKKEINDKLTESCVCLRKNFIDVFLAIDKRLYSSILGEADSLFDNLTKNIFDEGVNLSHKPKFEELITSKITYSKTNIINILFKYSG